MVKIEIVEASPDWAERCLEFCRITYRAAYVNVERGITPELFSKDIYNSERIRNYFQKVCTVDGSHKTWLALKDNKLLGMVRVWTDETDPNVCLMGSFYVHPEHQGQGIGHQLFQKVLEFTDGRAIKIDVVEYVKRSIELYEHWGFRIAPELGTIVFPTYEWPEEVRQQYRAIFMIRPATKG